MDVTQHVFSSKVKGKTKKETEKAISKIAERWVTEKDRDEFEKSMNALIKNVKNLGNQIKNLRHTDKSTIELKNPDFFKMIKNINIAISELAILSLQDEYIITIDADALKNEYMDDFSIENKVKVIKIPSSDVDLSDIPF